MAKKSILRELTGRECLELLSRPCDSCGAEAYEVAEKVYGVGFTVPNSYPSCRECRRIRDSQYTYKQMLRIGPAVRAVREGLAEPDEDVVPEPPVAKQPRIYRDESIVSARFRRT